MPAVDSSRKRDRLRDPVFWSGVVQLAKVVVAGVLAWVIAGELFELPQSFLAPWSALLVVHATVYRTFAQGVRQVAAAVAGVVLAWGVGNTIGVDAAGVAVVLAVGLALGSLSWLRGEVTTVAATALIVLTTGISEDDVALLHRLADTGIGIAVGLLVNVAVWPPLRRRTAIAAMGGLGERLGELLVDVADGLSAGQSTGEGSEDIEEWLDRTRDLERDIDQAWALLRQASESARLNPRRSAEELRDPTQWQSVLEGLEQAVADTRSSLRTIGRRPDLRSAWQASFRAGYLAVLRDAGAAIEQSDLASIDRCRDRLDGLVGELNREESSPLWPVYGGLLVNLRNVVDAMGDVAAAGPFAQPPLPFSSRRARSGRS